MAKRRLCRRCHTKLEIDQETCPACGEHNPIPKPWYTPFLGGLIIIILGYFLIDFGAIAEFLGLSERAPAVEQSISD